MKISLITLLLFLSSFAQAQIEDYSRSREISTSTETWHKMILPNEMFGQVKSDFSDLRIYGISEKNDTIEAPYIVRTKVDKIVSNSIPFKKINASHNDKGYYYTFELGDETALNEIELNFKSANFDWKVNMEGSQNQKEWFTLAEDYRVIGIKNELTDYEFSKVVFPSSKYRYFRILVKSETDPELVGQNLSLQETTSGDYQKYSIISQNRKEDKKSKQTVIHFDLGEAVPVSNLTLDFAKEVDFYRTYKLQYLADSFKVDKGWKYTYNTVHSGVLTSIENNILTFEPKVVQNLKLTINNRDNTPLILEKAVIKGPVYKLISRFSSPANYALYYGNTQARKPNYDISRFLDKIPADLKNLNLGKESILIQVVDSEDNALFQSKYWLWGVMLVIMVLLAWFSMGMLKK
ncbi:MAG: hypothetical protein ACI85O_002121 [Saprospiraceae bacterium]|jgi:hypothetical protein